jgi:SnoaL-like domain
MNLQEELTELRATVGVLQDKDQIRELQYAYGYFIDNRMFREMADLFADEGAWMEIGNRGRYLGKERIHAFLHEVLGGGRWGLLRDEVINHVQQQMIITISDDRQHAWARSRAQVQGNSPPDTPYFLFADGIYENEYVREGGRWKILGITVTMTYYTSLARERIWFPTSPPSDSVPPDLPGQPVDAKLGRQFNAFHFRHPLTGEILPTPHS